MIASSKDYIYIGHKNRHEQVKLALPNMPGMLHKAKKRTKKTTTIAKNWE